MIARIATSRLAASLPPCSLTIRRKLAAPYGGLSFRGRRRCRASLDQLFEYLVGPVASLDVGRHIDDVKRPLGPMSGK